ncbi:VTT domain-containing protein [Hydrogenophaga sp. NH-16]|uniref:DedA family protein n=1 Tax=Hydrogenophaga sp. NH-16 TaxID=2184519 RepID=UPI000FDC1019|nr:VTT domain-containing protein [Hydrogenophaga sp. NH-16]
MSDLSGALLTALINQGQWLLASVLFLAALGVPLPASMLLLAAGAFARQGVLEPATSAATGVAAAVTGDMGCYLAGRLMGQRLPLSWRSGAGWQRASDAFGRHGGWAVLLTRFLLTPLALPVNLLAGSTRLPLHRFLLPVMVGEVIWVALFGGLGYVFADRWEWVSAWAEDSVGLLLGGLLAAAGLWGLWRLR